MQVTVARLKIGLLTAVLLALLALIALPYFSLQPVLDSISYKLSQRFYHVQLPRFIPGTSDSPSMTVRSVYFDSRPRYGYHNASVFMVEMRKTIIHDSLITGCLVGGLFSSEFKIHSLNINGWRGNFVDEKPFLSHTMAMVDCFNLPAKNGSKAALLYKTSPNGILIPAESERPLLIPHTLQSTLQESGQKQNSYPYKIATCVAVVYGRPPFLKDWLHYQKTIGVDHVHMIIEDSFVQYGGLQQEYVNDAIKEGFLSVDVWVTRLRNNVEIQYHSQMLAYHDCIYRFQGVYDYMLFMDQDDFFIPVVSNQKTIHYYIDNWCYRGSCLFKWIEYYPDCGMSPESRSDGNITRLLTSSVHKSLPFDKCLHKMASTIEVGIHDPREMMAGHHSVPVPSHVAYVAHVRTHRRPPMGRCN